MIYFVTKSLIHKVVEDEGKLIIKNELSQDDLDYIINLPILGVDYEANSLDPYIVSPLLLILGDKDNQYVIDCTTIDCTYILSKIPEDKLVIGANLKYDYKIAKIKHNHIFAKMFDVMIAEQRLLQGITEFNAKKKKIAPISCSLESIIYRRLGILPNGMDKRVRNEFIDANPNTFVFENRHIAYAAADIVCLFDIRIQQKKEIEEQEKQLLIYGIEFPLIRELADGELEGFVIDKEKWLENIRFNKEQKFEYQCKLDIEVRRLRDTLNISKDNKQYLIGGIWDRDRKKSSQVSQENIFGDMFADIETQVSSKKKAKKKVIEPYINYGSPDQLVYIFARLGQEVPLISGHYAIPIITNKNKVTKKMGYTTGATAMESYILEKPSTPMKVLIELLIKYREYNTRLNTFGEEFLIKYKNRVTNKYHTIFRQCNAVNGRLQSGDKDNGWFNCQNIPAEKRYRECFKVEGNYDIHTNDLAGAEATIMIDKARDEKFYEIAIKNDDAHSPLATAVWRAIGYYRLSNGSNRLQEWYNEGIKYSKGSSELAMINISKKENKYVRTEYKNVTFADIYGCHDKKRAKMLNISVEEAKIAGKTQKGMIPKTYQMVERNAKFALMNGYLILNTRTNSRIWYPDVLNANKNKSDLEFMQQVDIESSARNAPISGTQADMVKEMIVEINKEIRRQKLDAAFLIQVHDELVYKSNKNIKLVEFINDKTKQIELVSFGEFISKWMIQVANRYLSFIGMNVSHEVGNSWIK